MTLPPALEKWMFGFIESQTLFVCHDIGLFDYLDQHGSATCDDISLTLNVPKESLERLLIVAKCMELLEKNNEAYQLKKEYRDFLTSQSPKYCGKRFSHYWKNSYKMFDYLQSGLQENKPQWYRLNSQFAKMQSVYHDAIYHNKKNTEEFLETMWASGFEDSIDLCKKVSFENYQNLVDLGGATGSFAIAALKANPKLKANVFDFPQVQAYAEEKFSAYGVDNRCTFLTGNFFEDPLPPADIYVIGYVLSDWPKDKCLALIKKVYENLPENGLIIILEKFFNEDKTGPYVTAMLNLTMLLEMYGTHRSVSEYTVWLEKIGFFQLQTVYSTGEKHMIMARK